MKHLLLIIATFLCLSANWPCYSQHNNVVVGADESEFDSKQTANPQLNRITQQLQQYQVTLNESAGYPDISQIQKDLIGHSLAEGVENGYRQDDWRWKIEEGQISQFKIAQVVKKTKGQYVIVAKMRLSNGYYSYDANVKIKYVYTTKNRWKLDYVVSEGMYIVVTHEYDGFIRSEIVEDGWGGTYCLQCTNLSELSLGVGGEILTYDGWIKFSKLVPAGEKVTAGGLFAGGTVKDYRINFIIRVN